MYHFVKHPRYLLSLWIIKEIMRIFRNERICNRLKKHVGTYLKPLTFSSSLAAMDLSGVGLPSLASVMIDSDSWSEVSEVIDAWRARFWANFKVCSSMLFLSTAAAGNVAVVAGDKRSKEEIYFVSRHTMASIRAQNF